MKGERRNGKSEYHRNGKSECEKKKWKIQKHKGKKKQLKERMNDSDRMKDKEIIIY